MEMFKNRQMSNIVATFVGHFVVCLDHNPELFCPKDTPVNVELSPRVLATASKGVFNKS